MLGVCKFLARGEKSPPKRASTNAPQLLMLRDFHERALFNPCPNKGFPVQGQVKEKKGNLQRRVFEI